jgi:hypothetical protein
MPVYEFFGFEDAFRVADKFQFTAGKAEPLALRPAMYEIAGEMMLAEGVMFRSQGRRFGGSWKHLKPDTVRQKGNTRILFSKGSNPTYGSLGNQNTLYRSLTYPNAPYQILHVLGYDMEFGTERPYAHVHQHGGGNYVPARPFLRFGIGDRRKWNRIIRRHIRYGEQGSIVREEFSGGALF